MAATFVDANVFVYAFLKPNRKLQPHEIKIKDTAKQIVTRISEGEETVTSVVHFSEICNILEDHLSIEQSLDLEKSLLFLDNLQIKEVTQDDYLKALAVTEDQQIGANDALAYVIMKEMGLNKVYSFAKDLDKFTDIHRTAE